MKKFTILALLLGFGIISGCKPAEKAKPAAPPAGDAAVPPAGDAATPPPATDAPK